MNEPQTMLYRRGTMIICGPYALDYIVVNDSDIEGELAKGWFKTPAGAEDGALAEEEAERQAAEEQKQAALQAEIDANNAALDQSNKKPASERKPKKSTDDNTGE